MLKEVLGQQNGASLNDKAYKSIGPAPLNEQTSHAPKLVLLVNGRLYIFVGI